MKDIREKVVWFARHPYLVSLAFVACMQSGDQPPESRSEVASPPIVGCYALVWQRSPGNDAPLYDVPDTILLSQAPMAGHPRWGPSSKILPAKAVLDYRLVEPSDPGARLAWYRIYRSMWWQSVSGDSLRMVFSDDAYVSWTLVLGRQADSLSGTADMKSDAGGDSAHVRGARIPCTKSQFIRE